MYIYIYIHPEVLKSGSALILRAGSYFLTVCVNIKCSIVVVRSCLLMFV